MTTSTQERYKGSVTNRIKTKQAIAEKFGEFHADKYDPKENCFTEKMWKTKGFKVKADEQPIVTITTMKTFFQKDEVTGQYRPSGRRPAVAKLYYVLQVEPA